MTDVTQETTVPPAFYEGPRPGDRISTAEEFKALPPGTVVTRASDTYTSRKGKNGLWEFAGRYREDLLDQGVWVVDTIGRALPETVAQFEQRFRDVVFAGEQQHFGSDNYSEKVLGELGIEFNPTVGMRVRNRHDRNLLPEGTRVFVGHPDEPKSFGLFEKVGGRWRHLFGSQVLDPASHPAIIDALPREGEMVYEPDDWWTERATPEHMEALAARRKQVWDRGYREKRNQNWCATYESVVRQAGLTKDSVEQLLPYGMDKGDTLAASAVVYLPLGTYLWGQYRDGTINLFRRDASSRNRAGTIRITGDSGKHYTPSMTIVGTASDDINRCRDAGGIMPAFDSKILEALPVGSQIKYLPDDYTSWPNESECFEKHDTTLGGAVWRRRIRTTIDDNNSYRSDQFTNDSDTSAYAITRIGA